MDYQLLLYSPVKILSYPGQIQMKRMQQCHYKSWKMVLKAIGNIKIENVNFFSFLILLVTNPGGIHVGSAKSKVDLTLGTQRVNVIYCADSQRLT